MHNVIKKLGTNEDAFTCMTVTRVENDLKDIKEVYYKRNNIHLKHTIVKGISSDYKNFLLTLTKLCFYLSPFHIIFEIIFFKLKNLSATNF